MTEVILNVAIIVDPMGHSFGSVSPEEEMDEHERKFMELLAPAKFNTFRSTHFDARVIPDSTDLMLFDYGGMGFGNHLGESFTREMLRWAEDHPSALIVIVSGFFYRNCVQVELRESGLTLPNIVCEFDEDLSHSWDFDYKCIPEWFRLFHNLPEIEEAPEAPRTSHLAKPKRRAR